MEEGRDRKGMQMDFPLILVGDNGAVVQVAVVRRVDSPMATGKNLSIHRKELVGMRTNKDMQGGGHRLIWATFSTNFLAAA